MPITNAREKFIHEIGDAYDAEHQFLQAMNEMMQQTENSNVQSMLQEHIRETEQQIQNLEQAYQALGEQPQRVKCDGAAGIISEAKKLLKETSGNPAIQDAAIAGGWSKAEHYEIATYRGLVTGAEQMGEQKVLDLLRKNLQQEEKIAQRIEQHTPQLIQQAMSAKERGK